MPLPEDAKSRKEYPLYSGLFVYFPDALAEVAHVSWIGNEQHNPGQPLHWDRSKSTDEPDALLRHVADSVTSQFDSDGVRHSAKAAWRALARLQKEIEADQQGSATESRAIDVEDPTTTYHAESKEWCLDEYHGWVCTRKAHHAGKHHAHYRPKDPCMEDGHPVVW